MHANRLLTIPAAIVLFAVPAVADWVVDTVSVDSSVYSMVVNPITNKVFALGSFGYGTTVIDGVTHITTNVPDDFAFLLGLVGNPLSNRVYYFHGVPVGYAGRMVEINGQTLDTVGIETGIAFSGLSVNATTNRIYGQSASGWVYEVDGPTRDTVRFSVDSGAFVSAVNPATNRVCLTNSYFPSLTVLDPVNGDTVQAPTGGIDGLVAVNPATNRAYVSNMRDRSISVIDLATLDTALVPADTLPRWPTINPATNRVYVGSASDNVTVIDGYSNDTALVKIMGARATLAYLDPVANEVYVRYRGGFVSVIDGVTNEVTAIPGDTNSAGIGLALNPVTGRYYALVRGRVYVMENADYRIDTVPGWFSEFDVEVDPVRNRAWVASWRLGALTMVDGATLDTTIVPVHAEPERVVVDPVANRVFAVGGPLTIVDGATLDTTEVPIPYYCSDGAVNVATGKLFLAHEPADSVTVLDPATLEMELVPTGEGPRAVAVNPHTDRAYVANYWGSSVTVVDGATLDTALIPVAAKPFDVAVNTVTNRIYVTCYEDASVTEINGKDNSTTRIAAGAGASWVAVNAVTNQIFVVNYDDGTATVIDGASRETRTVTVGQHPKEVVVDPVRDKAYVACHASGEVWVIDGATCAAHAFATGPATDELAVNPVTGQLYCLNTAYNIYAVTPSRVTDTKLHAYLDPSVACTTGFARPSLSGTAVNRWSPYRTPILGVLNRVGTARRDWNTALPIGSPADSVDWYWQWGDDSLVMGENFLCCLPVEANVATTQMTNAGSPYVGNLQVYAIYRTSLSGGVCDAPPLVRHALSTPTIVRGVLTLGAVGSRQNTAYRTGLLNAAGRKVLDLHVGANDIGHLAPGVYFLRSAESGRPHVVHKVIVTR